MIPPLKIDLNFPNSLSSSIENFSLDPSEIYISKNMLGMTLSYPSNCNIIERYSSLDDGSLFLIEERDEEQTELNPSKKYTMIHRSPFFSCHPNYIKALMREMKLMRIMNNENLISFKRAILPQFRGELRHIDLITNEIPFDLYSVIHSNTEYNNDHIMFILYQILRGLKYMHTGKIIHGNLRPHCIFVNEICDCFITDYRLCKINIPEIKRKTYENCKSFRFSKLYSAPEIVLNFDTYDTAIDIWSIGCILAELLLRKQLFKSNKYQHEILNIIDIIGCPSEEEMSEIPPNKEFGMKLCQSLKEKKSIDWEIYFKDSNPQAIDLMRAMLEFNPKKRITCEEALKHPYLKDLHCPEDEPSFDKELIPNEWDFEEFNWKLLKREEIIELIYYEMLLSNSQEKLENYVRKLKEGKKGLEIVFDYKVKLEHNNDGEEDFGCFF